MSLSSLSLSAQTRELPAVPQKAEELRDESGLLRRLMVYNDDVNTFTHVIEVLVAVCHHSYAQAEQCTLIIHHRGKCAVKRGSYPLLRRMGDAMTREGLAASIE